MGVGVRLFTRGGNINSAGGNHSDRSGHLNAGHTSNRFILTNGVLIHREKARVRPNGGMNHNSSSALFTLVSNGIGFREINESHGRIDVCTIRRWLGLESKNFYGQACFFGVEGGGRWVEGGGVNIPLTQWVFINGTSAFFLLSSLLFVLCVLGKQLLG